MQIILHCLRATYTKLIFFIIKYKQNENKFENKYKRGKCKVATCQVISLKMKLGFLENDDSEEDETSDSNWIYTEDGEEDKKEISLFDSSSEEEMVTNLVHQLLQTISFPKPNRGKKHLLQIMLVEKLCMSFDKDQNQRGFHLSTQKKVILSLYICGLLFKKPYVSELTNQKEP